MGGNECRIAKDAVQGPAGFGLLAWLARKLGACTGVLVGFGSLGRIQNLVYGPSFFVQGFD